MLVHALETPSTRQRYCQHISVLELRDPHQATRDVGSTTVKWGTHRDRVIRLFQERVRNEYYQEFCFSLSLLRQCSVADRESVGLEELSPIETELADRNCATVLPPENYALEQAFLHGLSDHIASAMDRVRGEIDALLGSWCVFLCVLQSRVRFFPSLILLLPFVCEWNSTALSLSMPCTSWQLAIPLLAVRVSPF